MRSTTMLLLLLIGCGDAGARMMGLDVVAGSGVTATDERALAGLADVRRVEADGTLDVEVRVDPAADAAVVVEADDNLLPLVRTTVSGDRLTVTTRGSYQSRGPLRVRVTLPRLTRFEHSGTGSASISGVAGESFALVADGTGDVTADADVATLTVRTTGTGTARLSGRAATAALEHDGTGTLDAADLRAGSVRVRLTGTGDAVARAAESADLALDGVGTITLLGDPPAVRSRDDGVGRIVVRGAR